MSSSADTGQVRINGDCSFRQAISAMGECYAKILIVTDSSDQIIGVLHKTIMESMSQLVSLESPLKTLFQPDNADTGLSASNLSTITYLVQEILRLDQERKTLREIIEYSSDSIYVADGEGKTILVNRAFQYQVGVPPEEMIGRKTSDLEKEGVYYPSATSIVLKEKREITVRQKTESSANLIVTAVPIFDEEGKIYRVVCNSRDIEELKSLVEYLSGPETIADMTIMPNKKTSLVFQNKKMQQIVIAAQEVASTSSTVLITGESGVGKEVVARFIHQCSGRSNEKFIHINCGAIPEMLLESELFGYEAGAFTGASKGGKKGLIEAAGKGTLFLDEIAEMPINMQVKLLTVIQNKQVTRIGGTKPTAIDVRFIAATNKALQKLVECGQFRSDLYYRLNVIPIHIPPLRERKEDIPSLIEILLEQMSLKFQRRIKLSPEVVQLFMSYEWPGNIREMENVLERIVVTSKTSVVIEKDLPFFTYNPDTRKAITVNKVISWEQAMAELEEQLFIEAYKTGNSSRKIAKILGISQSTANRKLKKYVKTFDA